MSINHRSMATRDRSSSVFNFRYLCNTMIIFSICSVVIMLFLISWNHCRTLQQCYSSLPYQTIAQNQNQNQPINLLSYPFAWNHLTFPSDPPAKFLKIALFVKKWPQRSRAGGLERHAQTLHLALSKRGHELHIFTTTSLDPSLNISNNVGITASRHHIFHPKPDALQSDAGLLVTADAQSPHNNLHFHFSKPTPAGYLDQATVWEQFQAQNSSSDKPFDIVHTESVALRHTRSRNVTNLAVTWHGIAYETIHSDIIQELLRSPQETESNALKERAMKVVEEVKFFSSYAHHVATSDHAGDILKRVYMIPEERVHIILNGVDQQVFKPDASMGKEFRKRHGVPDSKSFLIGLAGRLVKDKGHPLMFEALKQIIAENRTFQESSMVLVAGDGPWAARYRELGTNNVLVLGPLEQAELASFYNAIDIFVNPTLRAQGLDHTLLEAMLSGKPVMGTRLASISGSVIVGTEMGYTFSPTVSALKKAMIELWAGGSDVLKNKGQVARQRGLQLFTATKMVAAYERLLLCLSSVKHEEEEHFCKYQP